MYVYIYTFDFIFRDKIHNYNNLYSIVGSVLDY